MDRYSLVFKGPSIKWGPNAVPVPFRPIYTINWFVHCLTQHKDHWGALLNAVSMYNHSHSTLTLKVALSDVISCWRKLPFFSTVSASLLKNASLWAGSLSFNTFWQLHSDQNIRIKIYVLGNSEERRKRKPKTIMCGEHFPFFSS